MKSTMLKSVREEAGLGCPPQQFTTNSSEAINFLIKKHVCYKSNQLCDFVAELKEAIDEQERKVERAVIGRGKYRFRKQYTHLQVPESRWFKMTDQRRAHLHKVGATATILPSDLGDSSQSVSASTVTPVCQCKVLPHLSRYLANAKVYQLSVDVNSVADAVTVPALCPQNIWQKAKGCRVAQFLR